MRDFQRLGRTHVTQIQIHPPLDEGTDLPKNSALGAKTAPLQVWAQKPRPYKFGRENRAPASLGAKTAPLQDLWEYRDQVS